MRVQALLVTTMIVGATTHAAAVPIDVQWGAQGDVPLPRDFDRDGYADFVVWRPSDGFWYVKNSATGATRLEQWGAQGDVPLMGDYDGDGRQDFVVYRPSNGVWYVKNHDGAYIRYQQWGLPGDIPVSGDFDGDGRHEFVVWRPGNGVWYMATFTGAWWTVQWGQAGDVLVPGDYDGEPGDDFAYWRPSTGNWATLGSITNQVGSNYFWGQSGDIPSTARFDCTGRAGHTIWRPWSNGDWYVWGQQPVSHGAQGDIPVAANFTGDASADYATWRPSTGRWLVRNHTTVCDTRWTSATAAVDAAANQLQGITVAAVNNGTIVWSYGAGMANAWQYASPAVPFQLASVSKLFIATAALQMIDDSLLTIDSPSGLSNPNTVNESKPTLRHHVTHTSGIKRNVCFSGFYSDPPSSLFSAIDPCLGPESPTTNWSSNYAGTVTDYSNLGAAWVARMVEQTSGIDFAQYTREQIFTPLGMTSTAWFTADLPGRQLAIGHTAPNTPVPWVGVSPYPMGNLRASALDLARFMIMYTSDGTAFGQQVLAPGTVAFATTPKSTNEFGVFWESSTLSSGRQVWGHGGALSGVCARLSIDPATRQGVVVLANHDCAQANAHINVIFDRVYATLATL